MSSATVYCAAPISEILPLLGDPSTYEDVEADNDGYEPYQSLVELWAPTDATVERRAREVATVLATAGHAVAIRYEDEPETFTLPRSA